MRTENFLATYGTLAPGKPNHLQLADLSGSWSLGTVKGSLVNKGWGAALGYPALVLGVGEGRVDVHVFESVDLPDHWARLDTFEGSGYRRVRCEVETSEQTIDAWIYVEAESAQNENQS